MKAAPPVVQDGPDVLLTVRVQPRASRNELAVGPAHPQGHGSPSFTIRLTAPPVEGAANEACRAFLADLLRLPKSHIILTRGETGRHKWLRIRDADAATILARLTSPK
jgi:uncharacterized protein (TIGR00251 family)